MTNEQLYLAIGVPIILNAVFNGTMFIRLSATLTKRLDDLKEMWRVELRRVEEVLDARLKHLEEHRP